MLVVWGYREMGLRGGGGKNSGNVRGDGKSKSKKDEQKCESAAQRLN